MYPGMISPFVYYVLQPAFLVGIGCGVCLGLNLLLRRSLRAGNVNNGSSQEMIEADGDGDDDIKLILVVRTDLKMGKGKAAAQCAHAAVSAYQKAKAHQPNILKQWEENGQPKVVVKCDSQVELLQLSRKAKELHLITSIIRDAGRTQIAAGSVTVLGVGPGPADVIDVVTGHLKLY